MTNWFGDQPFGVWPWAQSKLGNAKPVVLNLDNGIQVQQIAGLKPDLIVATDAGLDQDTYQKLAAIAPTLAQSDGSAFFEPWKDQAKAIGQAVFQSGQIASLISGVDKSFAAVADKYPQFKNKRVVLLQGKLARRQRWWRRPVGEPSFSPRWAWPSRKASPPLPSISSARSFPATRSSRCSVPADVLIWTTESDKDQGDLLANPDVAELRSRSVFTTKDQAGAIAYASPLSYPLVADQLPALIANILH